MKNLIVVQNQVINNSLGFLRDKKTDTSFFRQHAQKLIYHLIAGALTDTDLEKIEVVTEFKKTKVGRLSGKFILLPILRAGIAMLEPALNLLPGSAVGFAGLVRDEKTAIAQEYYWKVPPIKDNVVLILDPMLATGGSILHVLKKLKTLDQRPKEVRVISIVSAPEGVTTIHKEFPEVKIFTAALDEGLNDKKFIVPGLGDFGDRFFKTEGL